MSPPTNHMPKSVGNTDTKSLKARPQCHDYIQNTAYNILSAFHYLFLTRVNARANFMKIDVSNFAVLNNFDGPSQKS